MAKVPVTLLFNVDDKASPGLAKINQALQRLEGVAGGFNTSLKDRLSGFDQISKASKALGQSAIGVGAALTAGITAPLVGLGASAIKVSADYEQAMNDLQARTGASSGEIASLGAEARRLGLSTTFGAKQAVEAMTALGKAGFETNDILKSTSGVLNLAAAETMGMDEAANLVSDTLNQFGLAASEANSLVDKLAKASGISSISIQDLQLSMKYSAPIAKSFGVGIEQVAGAIATLGSAGIKGEQAGTAMRSLLNTITADSDKIAKLQKAGISGRQLFSDKAMTQLRSLPEVLGALKGANLSPVQRFEIFGKEFGGTIGKLIESTGALKDNITKIGESAGFAAEVAGARTKGFWGEWQKLKNAVDDFFITITEGQGGFLDIVTGFIGKVTELVKWFKDLSPETRNFGLAVLGVGAVFGPLVGAFGLFLTLLPAMLAGWGSLAVGAGILSAAILPAGLSMGAILGTATLIGAAGFLIYKNWDNLKPLFNWLGDKLSSMWTIAKEFINALSKITNFGLNAIGIKSIPMLDTQPQSPVTFSGKPFSAQEAVNNGALMPQKNELFVNLGGNVPLGTTVKEGANNTSDIKLKLGGAMQ